MIEVAYLVASGRCVVVVAQPYAQGQTIMGEVVSDTEYHDLVAGQSCLVHLVKSKGVKIHEDLSSALQCTAKFFQSPTSPEEQMAHKLSKLEEEYQRCKGSIDVHKILDIHERLTNRRPDAAKVEQYLTKADLTESITFDQFLTLMSEIDGCDMCTMRLTPTNNNTCAGTKSRWACHNGTAADAGGQSTSQPTPNPAYRYDVFLGGSSRSAAKWRDEYAPLFDSRRVSYYNPTIRDSRPEPSVADEDEWKAALDESRVKLFVITNDTRSLTSMVLASYCLATKPESVVLCVQHLPDGCVVQNETLTKNAVKDYNRARVYLTDLAKRKQVKVFATIQEAVEESIEMSKR